MRERTCDGGVPGEAGYDKEQNMNRLLPSKCTEVPSGDIRHCRARVEKWTPEPALAQISQTMASPRNLVAKLVQF